MKKYMILLFCMSLVSCTVDITNSSADQESINKTLDQWHKAAANADFKQYFEPMSDDAVFIGTDATENWNKHDFMIWAKPYFEKGKAWNFHSMERHIYFGPGGKIAWFDELLNTQMKICRGSGVLVKEGNEWKIKHYVLSMTVPNDLSNDVIKLKSSLEDVIINKIQGN